MNNVVQIGGLAVVTLRTVTKIKCKTLLLFEKPCFAQEMVDSVNQINIIKW